MNFYVTRESVEKIKQSFLYLSYIHIIDINKIFCLYKDIKKDNDGVYFNFFINDEIKSQINSVMLKKRINNIIYSNKDITIETIKNLKRFLKDIKIKKIILIEDKNNQNINLHSYFDEVIFFPKQKKIKIIECENIKNPIYYWINNLKFKK